MISNTKTTPKSASKTAGYTQNRELSWLKFNERVLLEGRDAETPLLERLNFAAIFASNLAEFFMIRVGSLTDLNLLKNPPTDNKSGMTPDQQLSAVFEACVPLYRLRDDIFHEIENDLAHEGIRRLGFDELEGSARKFVQDYAKKYILPILSPQIIDPHHPFPHLENGVCYIGVLLKPIKPTKKKKNQQILVGLIPVPASLPHIVFLPGDGQIEYLLCNEIILAYAEQIFDMYTVADKAIVCVTRNADINPDDEAFDDDDDYRVHMKKILKKRTRLAPVRLETSRKFPKEIIEYACAYLKIKPAQIFATDAPLDMSYVGTLADHVKSVKTQRLNYSPFSPQNSPQVDPFAPICVQVEHKDILLSFPFESMEPFLKLIRESASDPAVLSIKITLYRVARQSRLIEYLATAAENGKDVTVLVELKARFDEENNIGWAEHLEESGCSVLYGFEGYKVHSKICLITRNDNGLIRRITQLGTGNYHEKTAKLYTDFSLITSDPIIGEDANTFFRNMSLGNLEGEYRCLKVAPTDLRVAILAGIDGEIAKVRAGGDGRVVFKMNSLTDRHVIDKLVDASRVGVQIKLIIRGICCLVPGIEGLTDNITVISIIGRFLEHSRIYCFGKDRSIHVFLSSADMMTRNTERRVEIAFPIIDEAARDRIVHYLDVQLSDTVKARRLKRDGTYEKIPTLPGQVPINCQHYAMAEAVAAASHIDAHKPLIRDIVAAPTTETEDRIVFAPQKQEGFFKRLFRRGKKNEAFAHENDEGLTELAQEAARASKGDKEESTSDDTAQQSVPDLDAPVAAAAPKNKEI